MTTPRITVPIEDLAPKAEPVKVDPCDTHKVHGIHLDPCCPYCPDPEAPKVEQEPVAWQATFEPTGQAVTLYRDPTGMEGWIDVTPLYTHPAPASDELLEALKPFADAAEDLDEAETGSIWERPSAMSIDASDLRRAAKLYAKHKGPQS